MDIEAFQDFCRSLPGTTEDMKWGHNLVFSVGLKMYAVVSFDEEPPRIGFKTEPALFEALTHQDHIIPAPYLARAHWVSLLRPDALPEDELTGCVQDSYDLVFAKLTKKAQRQIRGEG